MINVSYRPADRRAVLTWGEQDEATQWLGIVRRLVLDSCEETRQEAAYQLSLPWWAFSSLRSQLLDVFRGFGLSLGTDIAVEGGARELLLRSTANAQRYADALRGTTITDAQLTAKLKELGFSRELKSYQVRNVHRLVSLPAGATFSVPGAGKTTEALAVFFYRAGEGDRLLVIAPKNAFAAWEEQLSACMPSLDSVFIRLQGGQDKISRLLSSNPRFMLITYQQLTRVRELIAQHISQQSVHVFLDESHRIKSGIAHQTADAVLSLSHLPVGKLIMSGTPMPQSVDDLIPQFAFLYPEIKATPERVVDLMRPVYVRTSKGELGLRPAERVLVKLRMAPVQEQLYSLMRHEVAREAAAVLSIRSKQALRRLGRSVARLLQFVSNPRLLSSELEFAHPELLSAVLAEGEGPKMEYVLDRTYELVEQGQKVLIWSSFVRNVEYIAGRLADVGAVFIHGGVITGDEDDDETREGKIRLFHDDPNVRVLVANPAAAGEGISLHLVCHHAIYLDRTFNAAHYLQSEERIHRIGLPENQRTVIELVECVHTIDETVRERLSYKVGAMAKALEDHSLNIDPIPLDPVNIEDPDDYVTGLSEDDAAALAQALTEDTRQ